MGKFVDLTGKRFGRLTVLNRLDKKLKKDFLWNCICDCGNYKITRGDCLKYKNTQSCGCLKKEVSRTRDNSRQREMFLKINQQKKKTNQFIIKEDCVEFLTRHGNFFIDVEDLEKISQYYWDIYRGYPTTQIKTNNCRVGRRKTFKLHRVLLEDIPDNMEVDHIDRNKLNNKRSNLRIVSHFDNMQNRGIQENNTSGFKNVSFNKAKNKFVGYFTYNFKTYYVGAYKTAYEANKAVLELKSKIIK